MEETEKEKETVFLRVVITLWEVASTKWSSSDNKEAMAFRARRPSDLEGTL